MAVGGRPDKIGKYEIVDDIGGGGMGRVYKARDPRMRRTVAIKVIKGDFSDNPEFLKRFDIEAQALASLVHPNIVVVHDLGDEHGSPYLVMEYLDGVPLDKIIAERQSVPIVRKLGIISDVLNALHYAHLHNIIHRDVKPANVMVLKTGTVKLLDFGIAREGDTGQTKTGLMMGTEWYMSPEQLNSEVADGRSDVYAAGIMFYELLAYSLPFDPRDRTGMIVKRLRGDPPPPLSKYLESYPPELDEIIARALAVNRDERYSTAEEFAFDVTGVQDRLKRDMVGHLVDQARESIARSDLAKAKNLVSEVLRIDTQNPTAKQLLYEIQLTLQRAARNEKKQQLRDQAAAALGEKNLDQAASLVEEAIKVDQTDPDLLGLREQVQQAKARAQQLRRLLALANVAQQSGELEMARKAVHDALALDPSDTDARLLQASVARLAVEQEKQHQIQQFIQAARREIAARQFTAAQENIAKAREMDQSHPEIRGLEQMVHAGLEQEARQRGLAQICNQIEQELIANRPKQARDIAANALRKYPGEPNLVRLRTAADIAVEKEERRTYIEERIATASRLADAGEASRALALLKDAERDYPTDIRLREYVQVIRQALARETAGREKQMLLQKARSAMGGKSFTEAVSVLEGGLLQFPDDAEIKELLKTAREEFELLSKKKQVEEVGKKAQELLQTRAHTDAIRLLERTVAQISDPELTSLLQYAQLEAAKFRSGLQAASEQATRMLGLGQSSEAVKFLEAHAGTYGKNAEFQVLLEQARKQTTDARRAQERLRRNLEDARAKLRGGDTHGAEAMLRAAQVDAPGDHDVLALAIEIEEEKKAGDRRRKEAVERALRAKEEEERRHREAAQRAEQAKQEEERRQREAADRALRAKQEQERLEKEAAQRAEQVRKEEERRQKEAADRALRAKQEQERLEKEAAQRGLEEKRQAAEAAKAKAALESASETRLFTPEAPGMVSPPVLGQDGEGGLATLAADVSAGAVASATEYFSPTLAPIPEEPIAKSQAPPAFEPPLVAPEPTKQTKKSKKRQEPERNAKPAPAGTPPGMPVEAARLRMEIVDEPKPVAPKPIEQPLPPPPPQPGGNKRLIIFGAGGLALVLMAVVIWLMTSGNPKPGLVSITGAPPGAAYQIGKQTGKVAPNGTASVSVPAGSYRVELNEKGYEPFSQEVSVQRGETANIPVAMTPIPKPTSAFLKIIGAPPHAKLHMGDISNTIGSDGTAEVETKPGHYKIEIDAPDYEHYSAEVQLELGKNEPLTVTIKPLHDDKFGTLVVRASVDHFDLFVDGQLKSNSGTGKQAKLEVLEGKHKIQIKRKDYEDSVPQSVDIVAKKELKVSPFDLKPIKVQSTDASLSVTVRPPSGRLRIDDGSPINLSGGSYSGKLTPGSHKIEASADGYQAQTQNITANAGETKSVPFDLQPIITPKPQPTLTVSAVPETIDQGQSAIVHWNTQNATQVTIDAYLGKTFDPNGQTAVKPDKDTTYTLIAKGPGGEKTESVRVTVRAVTPPPLPPPNGDRLVKDAVRAAIKAWQAAYQSRDGRKMEEAYPTIPPNFEKQIKAIPAAINVDYKCDDPRITGDKTVEMSCKESVSIVGGPPPKPRTVSVQFKPQGDKWVIGSLGK